MVGSHFLLYSYLTTDDILRASAYSRCIDCYCRGVDKKKLPLDPLYGNITSLVHLFHARNQYSNDFQPQGQTQLEI